MWNIYFWTNLWPILMKFFLQNQERIIYRFVARIEGLMLIPRVWCLLADFDLWAAHSFRKLELTPRTPRRSEPQTPIQKLAIKTFSNDNYLEIIYLKYSGESPLPFKWLRTYLKSLFTKVLVLSFINCFWGCLCV